VGVSVGVEEPSEGELEEGVLVPGRGWLSAAGGRAAAAGGRGGAGLRVRGVASLARGGPVLGHHAAAGGRSVEVARVGGVAQARHVGRAHAPQRVELDAGEERVRPELGGAARRPAEALRGAAAQTQDQVLGVGGQVRVCRHVQRLMPVDHLHIPTTQTHTHTVP